MDMEQVRGTHASATQPSRTLRGKSGAKDIVAIVANPSLVATNLTTLRCCVHVKNGESVVRMKYSTPCLATAAENAVVVSDGKSARKCTNPFLRYLRPRWRSNSPLAVTERLKQCIQLILGPLQNQHCTVVMLAGNVWHRKAVPKTFCFNWERLHGTW